jgi:ABC-type multidrug transport system fused ATPase/permease subunit
MTASTDTTANDATAMPAPTVLPRSLFRYIYETSSWHQLALLAMTVVVALVEVIPLALQRRIVNDAVKHRQISLIITLCAIYVGVVLGHGLIKMGLNIYRGWVGQRAVRNLRTRVRKLERGAAAVADSGERGIEISMIVAEAESVGLFVSSALSEPLLQGGILVSVFAYMVHIDWVMALIALGIFSLQAFFVPLMQRAINRLTRENVSLLRVLSTNLTDLDGAARYSDDAKHIDSLFTLNISIIKLKYVMNFLMNFCTHLQIIAALLYGSWLVINDQLVIGGVVAFISGVTRLTDPWGDLVNYFRDLSSAFVRYRLLETAVNRIAEHHNSLDPAGEAGPAGASSDAGPGA